MSSVFQFAGLPLVLAGGAALVLVRLIPLAWPGRAVRSPRRILDGLAFVAIAFGLTVSSIALFRLPTAALAPQLVFVGMGLAAFLSVRSLSWSLVAGLISYALALAWM